MCAQLTDGAGGRLILVVDDEPEIVDLYHVALTEAGYRVAVATTGGDALLLARTERPDLIILDVMLPGIGGFEASTLLHQDPGTAHIPILMVSAAHEPYRQAQGLAFGAQDYIAKPFDIADLLTRVATALAHAHPPSTAEE